eukprot:SAG31_NODE_1546_length_7927_cov_29.239525_2_plen_640_part_00
MAWNLIQSYPSVGNGMNYNGHGLTWAEVPWSGKYNVNSPIWVSAHYTQATEPGWYFLPVGAGSGMLPAGGSYVSLVSPRDCGGFTSEDTKMGFTLIVQTMEHDMSACFKDTHPPFSVSPQNVTFTLAPAIVSKLAQHPSVSGNNIVLQARRTRLYRTHVDDPYHYVPLEKRTNRYFELVPGGVTITPTGELTLSLGLNEIWTVTTERTGDPDALPPIPNASAWPTNKCVSLAGLPVDAPLVDAIEAMDQQGVFEAKASRDPALGGLTTIQQVVPEVDDGWHNWNSRLLWPQSFVGPAVNISALTPSSLKATVLPPSFKTGWVGIGFGGQANIGSLAEPGPTVFAIYSNGTWRYAGKMGQLRLGSNSEFALSEQEKDNTRRRMQEQWFNLSLAVLNQNDEEEGGTKFVASVNGVVVSTGIASTTDLPLSSAPFAFLAASYGTAPDPDDGDDVATPSYAEFRSLCLDISAMVPQLVPSPSPGPGPGPSPGPPPPDCHGLRLASCAGARPQAMWTFSGEDGGEPGTLRASSNSSACLDVSVRPDPPLLLKPCEYAPGGGAVNTQLWHFSSKTGQFKSVVQLPCLVREHGTNCSRCLDVYRGGETVDLFDCKPSDRNQEWIYSPNAGASMLKASSSKCLISGC